MVKWLAHEIEGLTSEDVYEILKRHQLLPDDHVVAAATCNAVADSSQHFELREGDEIVADVFVGSVVDGESAEIDFIPRPKKFRTGFDDPLAEAMGPILAGLFDERRVRRITAYAPYSRSRTKRALCSLGFVHEGKIRKGIHLFGEQPEDLRSLGLLKEEYNAG